MCRRLRVLLLAICVFLLVSPAARALTHEGPRPAPVGFPQESVDQLVANGCGIVQAKVGVLPAGCIATLGDAARAAAERCRSEPVPGLCVKGALETAIKRLVGSEQPKIDAGRLVAAACEKVTAKSDMAGDACEAKLAELVQTAAERCKLGPEPAACVKNALEAAVKGLVARDHPKLDIEQRVGAACEKLAAKGNVTAEACEAKLTAAAERCETDAEPAACLKRVLAGAAKELTASKASTDKPIAEACTKVAKNVPADACKAKLGPLVRTAAERCKTEAQPGQCVKGAIANALQTFRAKK